MATASKRVVGKPFEKGTSGNPGGRPKSTSITAVLRARLTDEHKVRIADALINGACAGEMDKIRELLDRTEGKVPSKHENGQPGDFDLDFAGWSVDELRDAAQKLRRVK